MAQGDRIYLAAGQSQLAGALKDGIDTNILPADQWILGGDGRWAAMTHHTAHSIYRVSSEQTVNTTNDTVVVFGSSSGSSTNGIISVNGGRTQWTLAAGFRWKLFSALSVAGGFNAYYKIRNITAGSTIGVQGYVGNRTSTPAFGFVHSQGAALTVSVEFTCAVASSNTKIHNGTDSSFEGDSYFIIECMGRV